LRVQGVDYFPHGETAEAVERSSTAAETAWFPQAQAPISMKKIKYTWPKGAISYSIPFKETLAAEKLEAVKGMIASDPYYAGVDVELAEATEGSHPWDARW